MFGDDLENLGVKPGSVLLVHTSFRAVGKGTPLELINALRAVIGPEGTLVMPTMADGESVFDPRTTPTVAMGVTAETFWRQPGVLRSTHPGGSFAAEGPHAERICAEQPLSPPHGHDSPVGRVYDLNGRVLLIGVTHSENTTLHLAESLAGVPYSVSHPTVVAEVQMVDIAETDHCCRGFRFADAWLGARQKTGKVGDAEARLFDSRDVVEVALLYLAQNPLVFLCGRGTGCDECDAAHASVRS
jgi:aminoglycoside 3-N-acetyltransferase